MSGSPHILFFQTNRSGMGYPANACRPEVFVGKLSARRPTYVALHPVYGAFTPAQHCIEVAIRQYPGRFTQVYRNAPAQIAIYRISGP